MYTSKKNEPQVMRFDASSIRFMNALVSKYVKMIIVKI